MGDRNKLSQFQSLFENTSDAICFIERESSLIQDCNAAFEELTGYLKEELKGKSVFTLKASSQSKRNQTLSETMIADNGTFSEVVIATKEKKERLCDLRVFDQTLILRDLTEKKALEREVITKLQELRTAYAQLEKSNLELTSLQSTLIQSGKMAALGELSVGIAHEMNQPLQAILGFSEELDFRLKNDKDNAPLAKEITQASQRLSQIIKNLRHFVRSELGVLASYNLETTLSRCTSLISNELEKSNVSLTLHIQKDLPECFGNQSLMEQVILNLLTNARDAVFSKSIKKGKIEITVEKRDTIFEIAVTDDGIGMSEEVRERAMNPFFTTKEVGRGMGLGLSLSYGMINQLQGTIAIESKPGKGTRVVVVVPVDFRVETPRSRSA